jgi:hypothetical protein
MQNAHIRTILAFMFAWLTELDIATIYHFLFGLGSILLLASNLYLNLKRIMHERSGTLWVTRRQAAPDHTPA